MNATVVLQLRQTCFPFLPLLPGTSASGMLTGNRHVPPQPLFYLAKKTHHVLFLCLQDRLSFPWVTLAALSCACSRPDRLYLDVVDQKLTQHCKQRFAAKEQILPQQHTAFPRQSWLDGRWGCGCFFPACHTGISLVIQRMSKASMVFFSAMSSSILWS